MEAVLGCSKTVAFNAAVPCDTCGRPDLFNSCVVVFYLPASSFFFNKIYDLSLQVEVVFHLEQDPRHVDAVRDQAWLVLSVILLPHVISL